MGALEKTQSGIPSSPVVWMPHGLKSAFAETQLNSFAAVFPKGPTEPQVNEEVASDTPVHANILTSRMVMISVAVLLCLRHRRNQQTVGKYVPDSSGKQSPGRPNPGSPLRRDSWVMRYGTLDAAHDA